LADGIIDFDQKTLISLSCVRKSICFLQNQMPFLVIFKTWSAISFSLCVQKYFKNKHLSCF